MGELTLTNAQVTKTKHIKTLYIDKMYNRMGLSYMCQLLLIPMTLCVYP